MKKLSQRTSTWIISITIILAAEVFVADLVLPLGLGVWLSYGALVLISLWVPYRHYALIVATAYTVLILLGGYVSSTIFHWVDPARSFLDRAIGVLVIWLTTLLCQQRKRAEEWRRKAYEELEKQVEERAGELRNSNELLKQEINQGKRAAAELEYTRQQQLHIKDQFLSHVSHELRSPMSAMYQFLTILLDGLAGDLTPPQREYLEIVFRNANQLKTMIDDLLEVTRTQTGKLAVEPQPTFVPALIDDTVSSLRAIAGAKGLVLSADIPGNLPPVYADPQRVRQILINLIENAIKFTPQDGSITVRADISTENPRFLLVAVNDTGCGIALEEGEKIFEELYQANNTIEASRKGLGLGLYICKELVSRHGGRIWVESQKGHGSTFLFTLPVFSLAELFAPILTAENLREGSIGLVAVELCPIGRRPLTPTDRAALQKARRVVEDCVLPGVDVVLGGIGRTQRGETVFVVACAGPTGVGVLMRRIQRQLAACQELHNAGLVSTVSSALIDIPSMDEQTRLEGVVNTVVRSIEEQLRTTTDGKGEGHEQKESA